MSDDGRPPNRWGPGHGPTAVVIPLMLRRFTAATVSDVRHELEVRVSAAGLSGDEAFDFVLAVHELVTNAVRHGGGRGHVDLRRADNRLICDVIDDGAQVDSLPVGLPAVTVAGGRGLWLAQRLTGGLMLDPRPDGVTASVVVYLHNLVRDQPGQRTARHAATGPAGGRWKTARDEFDPTRLTYTAEAVTCPDERLGRLSS